MASDASTSFNRLHPSLTSESLPALLFSFPRDTFSFPTSPSSFPTTAASADLLCLLPPRAGADASFSLSTLFARARVRHARPAFFGGDACADLRFSSRLASAISSHVATCLTSGSAAPLPLPTSSSPLRGSTCRSRVAERATEMEAPVPAPATMNPGQGAEDLEATIVRLRLPVFLLPTSTRARTNQRSKPAADAPL
jgi:hypothetical protein